jgi:hypothetical protein
MSLSLKEKQLLRSLVELIIQNPFLAKKLFIQVKSAGDEELSATLEKIRPLISVVNNYNSMDDRYLARIGEVIYELNDPDARSIVKSSLENQRELIITNSLNY